MSTTTFVPIVVLLVLLLIVSSFRRLFLKDVGQKALANQPDQIKLSQQPGHHWKDAAAVGRLVEPLLKRGFTDLGPHSVDVMPHVTLRFLVNPAVSIYACVYEHAKVGTWLDLVSRYADGSGATFTTVRPTGLDPNPRETVVHAPGSPSDTLFGRMLVERPQRPLVRLDAAEVIRLFEAVYAEQILWRKTRGVSAREVGNVAAAPPRA